MLRVLQKDRWSPYAVGALIGLLLVFLVTQEHIIGASTAIARVGALMENTIASDHIQNTPYFSKLLSENIIFNWSVLFISGLFLGSWISSKLTKNPSVEKNTIWKARFGTSFFKRSIMAFIGGMFLMFGARFAGGCTSGHGISWASALALPSWVFLISVFAVGVPTALIMYRKK